MCVCVYERTCVCVCVRMCARHVTAGHDVRSCDAHVAQAAHSPAHLCFSGRMKTIVEQALRKQCIRKQRPTDKSRGEMMNSLSTETRCSAYCFTIHATIRKTYKPPSTIMPSPKSISSCRHLWSFIHSFLVTSYQSCCNCRDESSSIIQFQQRYEHTEYSDLRTL